MMTANDKTGRQLEISKVEESLRNHSKVLSAALEKEMFLLANLEKREKHCRCLLQEIEKSVVDLKGLSTIASNAVASNLDHNEAKEPSE